MTVWREHDHPTERAERQPLQVNFNAQPMISGVFVHVVRKGYVTYAALRLAEERDVSRSITRCQFAVDDRAKLDDRLGLHLPFLDEPGQRGPETRRPFGLP